MQIKSQKLHKYIFEIDTNSTDILKSSLRLLFIQCRCAQFCPASTSMADETHLPAGYHYGWYTPEQLNVYYDCMIGNYWDGGVGDDTDGDGVDNEGLGDGGDNDHDGGNGTSDDDRSLRCRAGAEVLHRRREDQL